MSLDDRLIVDQVGKKKKWISGGGPPECDICLNFHYKTTDLTKEEFFVDGKTQMGPWALMCPRCFKLYGVGLGTGRGQKYDSKTLEKVEG